MMVEFKGWSPLPGFWIPDTRKAAGPEPAFDLKETLGMRVGARRCGGGG